MQETKDFAVINEFWLMRKDIIDYFEVPEASADLLAEILLRCLNDEELLYAIYQDKVDFQEVFEDLCFKDFPTTEHIVERLSRCVRSGGNLKTFNSLQVTLCFDSPKPGIIHCLADLPTVYQRRAVVDPAFGLPAGTTIIVGAGSCSESDVLSQRVGVLRFLAFLHSGPAERSI